MDEGILEDVVEKKEAEMETDSKESCIRGRAYQTRLITQQTGFIRVAVGQECAPLAKFERPQCCSAS